MKRVVAAALAPLVVFAAPAWAQATYAPEVVVPRAVTIVGVPTVLVPRTHYVRRTVLVPRTRYVRRVLHVPVTTYVPRRAVVVPVAGYATTYPGTGLIGPTWVPPGTSYACLLGTIGCDSSVVGPMAF